MEVQAMNVKVHPLPSPCLSGGFGYEIARQSHDSLMTVMVFHFL